MSTDELVSRDLATTAAANRVPPRTLEHTLRAVGAIASPAEAPGASGTSYALVRWLVLGEIYASRVARSAAGIAALASLAVVVAFNAAKAMHLSGYDSHWFSASPLAVAILMLVAVLLVRIAARGWAAGAFARAVASPSRAERMLADSDRRALLLGIAGPFAFALVFGVSYFVLRGDPIDYFPCALDRSCWGDSADANTYVARLRDLAIAVPLGVAGALALARRPPGRRLVRVTGLVACLVLVGTLVVGLRFDDGPWPQNLGDVDYVPSPVLRQVLTITGSLGLFGVLAAIALWRRAAENARIASASS